MINIKSMTVAPLCKLFNILSNKYREAACRNRLHQSSKLQFIIELYESVTYMKY
jgi:hypothetical protein